MTNIQHLFEEGLEQVVGKNFVIHSIYSDDDCMAVVDSFDCDDADIALDYFRERITDFAKNSEVDPREWKYRAPDPNCNLFSILATHDNLPEVAYSLNFVELNAPLVEEITVPMPVGEDLIIEGKLKIDESDLVVVRLYGGDGDCFVKIRSSRLKYLGKENKHWDYATAKMLRAEPELLNDYVSISGAYSRVAIDK
jgi:hypothetical protein